jgi:hypothetical protein
VIGLTQSDTKHWAPVPQVVDYVASLIPEGARVLEIGPGHAPFRRATHFVDFLQHGDLPVTLCDLTSDPLPFHDKFFDFVYCRHVVEDMYNPFPMLREISRVGRAGYIETPSPAVEMCRGVDGGSPGYRGYHHHRFVVWVEGGQLRLVSKYPLVEYLNLDDSALVERLRPDATYWNTHYLWRNAVDAKHMQNALDFDMMRDYPSIVVDACGVGVKSNDEFWRGVHS